MNDDGAALPADAGHKAAELVLSMLNALQRLDDPRVARGQALKQLDHALQTATRAERAGADEELIVAALCHDLGKLFTWQKHGPVAAEILRPFVRPEVAWVVAVHEDFTPVTRARGGADDARRRRHRWQRGFHLAVLFADQFDTPAVDPGYETLPLRHFEPMVRRVFAVPRYQQAPSMKLRIARSALKPLRPFLGASADRFEDVALEQATAFYHALRTRLGGS